MPSTTVLVTAITSLLGLLITSAMTFLVLSRGRKKYHYLFAGVLLIVAIWDLGIFICMIRNSFSNELPIYGYIISLPCMFLPALIYHFTCSYLNQPRRKSTIFIWAFCIMFFVLNASGIGGKISGVYNYSWGNIFRPDAGVLLGTGFWLLLYYIFVWFSCWFLFRAYKREPSPTVRRHILYILISFLVISLANVKLAALYNVDNRYVMPTGMLLIDVFGALIGVAVIKHRLFDITLIVKKGTVYSLLVALIIFVFSCSEHLLSKYLGDLLGEQPRYIHLISIATVVGVLMPVRQRLERAIEGFFATRKVEF
jgi:hypothetical protein